jgi:hypothetical protein
MFEPSFWNECIVYSDDYLYVSVAEIKTPDYSRYLEGVNVAVIADVDNEYLALKWYDPRTLLLFLRWHLTESKPVWVRLYTDDGPEDVIRTGDLWHSRRVALAVNKATFERNRLPEAR